MSVTLTTAPPEIAFSGDDIRVKLTVDSLYINPPVHAVNVWKIPSLINAFPLKSFVFRWGSETPCNGLAPNNVQVNAVTNPNDSGSQIKAGGSIPVPIEEQAGYLKKNPILTRDFDISVSGTDIVFTAKQIGSLFNMCSLNTVPGSTPVLKQNLTVQFLLFCENANYDGFEQIYETSLIVYGNTLTSEAIISDKLHNYISAEIRNNLPDVPEGDPLLCKKSCRRYYFEFVESYGTPAQAGARIRSDYYTVLHGGLSFIGQRTQTLQNILAPGTIENDRFLKQGTTQIVTRTNLKQYLYFFNTRADVNARLYCTLSFADGSGTTLEPVPVTLLSKRKYAFDVSHDNVYNPADFPDKTLIRYAYQLKDSEGLPISEIITYGIDHEYKSYIRQFFNWSSWGTMDSRYFYGRGSMEFDLVQKKAEIIAANDVLMKGKSLIYDIRLQTKFTITTGFTSRSKLLFNRDFFLSKLKYRYTNGLMLPIEVTSKTISELTDEIRGLYAQKFEYQYLFDDVAHTESDVNDPGEGYEGWVNGHCHCDEAEGGIVEIINQFDEVIESIIAPGEYHVLQFSGIIDDGSGVYQNQIIDPR